MAFQIDAGVEETFSEEVKKNVEHKSFAEGFAMSDRDSKGTANGKGLKLSIVIVNWNTKDLLRDCLKSVFDTVRRDDFEVIVVENNSTDGSQEMLKTEFPQVHLMESSENLGFPTANTQGMYAAEGEYILCLNPDTIVYAGTVERVLNFLEENTDYGAAGCRLKLPNGSYQTAAAKLFHPLDKLVIYGFSQYLHKIGIIKMHAYDRSKYSDEYLRSNGTVDYIIGAFVMIRRELLEKVGGMDPRFFLYVDDLDWGLRINRAGYKIKHLMDCEILHIADATGAFFDRNSFEFQSTTFYWRKHYGFLGKLMFYYLKFSMMLRDHTVTGLQKLGLFEIRHLFFAVYMIICIPLEMLFLIPLEIKHYFLIKDFPSYKALRKTGT